MVKMGKTVLDTDGEGKEVMVQKENPLGNGSAGGRVSDRKARIIPMLPN
jgi:hypothetical protein